MLEVVQRTCWKCKSGKVHSDDYKVRGNSEGAEGVHTLEPVNRNLIEAIIYKNNGVVKQSQEC